MALEDLTGSNKYISNLVQTNPVGATDPESQGDDHIRGIKNVLLNTFPNITGPVTVTQAQLNAVANPAPVQCPIGMVCDFAGSSIPSGWLALPFVPTTISRATYAALYAAIGDAWGSGDGSTTFNMPYCPDGNASLNHATAGGVTLGSVMAHIHNYLRRASTFNQNLSSGSNAISYGAEAATATDNGSLGSSNMPAGAYFRKCVRYI
jgi:microcystin-dependent protein